MKRDINIIRNAYKYLCDNSKDISVEELFIEFEEICYLHREFELYIRDSALKKKLEGMKRGKRTLERRKLFVQWYFLKVQNDTSVKEVFINLSELVFASEKTIQNDLLK